MIERCKDDTYALSSITLRLISCQYKEQDPPARLKETQKPNFVFFIAVPQRASRRI